MPGKIKPLGKEPFSYTFAPEDARVIDEMVGHFGDTREDVIIKALSLLYTIYTERRGARTVIAQDGSGRTVIPL